MLKIENLVCNGNRSEKLKKICIFVHLSTEVKNRQNFKKIYFFYFQMILTLSDNDSFKMCENKKTKHFLYTLTELE